MRRSGAGRLFRWRLRPWTAAGAWKLDRQISLGLLLALIVQTSGALLWAGRTAERIDQLEFRLEAQAGVVERLARLEEQAVATRTVLARIEAKLDRER